MRNTHLSKSRLTKDGAILMADFTFENDCQTDIKDGEVTCTHYAASGTKIDSNRRTIYEIVRAQSTKTVKAFNMGFIDSQAKSSVCKITDLALAR